MHAHKIYDLIDNDVQLENYIADDQNFQILGGKFSILGVKYDFFLTQDFKSYLLIMHY